MSRTWYGSLQNRLQENAPSAEIFVGMGATEYHYTDRDPLEVIAVRDQKHVTVRYLDAIRTDNYGMSDCQNYEYKSNESNYSFDLVKRGAYWYTTTTMTAEDLDTIESFGDRKLNEEELRLVLWACQFDHEKVRKNGKQTRYHKFDISFGSARKYYDYSF